MLHRITLNLARSRTAPGGSARVAYEITAPPDDEGALSARAWRAVRER